MDVASRKDFFISYHQADRAWAEWISWQLEQAGYTTLLETRDFRAGQRALDESGFALALLSTDYLDSIIARDLDSYLISKDLRLLPIRVRECEIPYILRGLSMVDLVGKSEEAAREVLLAAAASARPKSMAIGPLRAEKVAFPVPEPRIAKPPAIWNLPARSPNFTGREDRLAALRDAFQSGPAGATQVLHGLGGIGKTQLAFEYAYRNLDQYDLVWFIDAQSPESLLAGYAALAHRLDLPEKDKRDITETVQAVLRWLSQNPRWLLILDNAPDAVAIRPYLPPQSLGHVLITSRNPNWTMVARGFVLDVLPREEAVQLLMKRSGQNDPAAADRLCEALGDLPLAIGLAGAYIESSAISITDYLEQFEQRAGTLLSGHFSSETSLAASWQIAFEHLGPAAADLLNLLAFLAPADIPRDLVSGTASDPLAFAAAVAELRTTSFIEAKTGSFSVHPLVQRLTRERLSEDAAKTCVEKALRLVYGAFHFDYDIVETWGPLARLLPHARAAAKYAESFAIALDVASALLNTVALYLLSQAQLGEARRIFEWALNIVERLGPEHPRAAVIIGNIGMVLMLQDNLSEASSYSIRALKMNEKLYGPDHPQWASSAHDLALILRTQGDLEGAMNLSRRALEIDQKFFGEHPALATYLSNIAWVLRARGDLEGALATARRALGLDEKFHGPSHPRTARDYETFAEIAQAQGDQDQAGFFLQRARGVYERLYPELTPDARKLANRVAGIMMLHSDPDLPLPATLSPPKPRDERLDEAVLQELLPAMPALLFLLVAGRHTKPEFLNDLNAGTFWEAIRKVNPQAASPGDLAAVRRTLEDQQPGVSPNQLWAAWLPAARREELGRLLIAPAAVVQ